MSLASHLKDEMMGFCMSKVKALPGLVLLSAGIDGRDIFRTPTNYFNINELLAKYIEGRGAQ